MYQHVLSSGKIGNLELRNRFVMPAMDSSATDISGKVNERLIAYYAARAKGGFCLLITEYTSVDYPDGMAKIGQLSLYDDIFIPGMNRLAEAVHKEGAKIFVQLQHPGRETSSEITGRQAVAPSCIPSMLKGKGIPRELTVDEIHTLVDKFAKAARRAKQAGMDGVELQCGHGYLVAQFLSGLSNKRVDDYGGCLENRLRFAVEIVRAIKKLCGRDFPVSCRVSGEERIPGGLTVEETMVIAKELEKAGADAIHVSSGTVASCEWLIAPAALPNGYNLTAARAVKEVVHIPVIGIGRITEPLMAEHVVADGAADFVALGRASVADPEFPDKVKENRINEISPCVGCLSRCFYTEGTLPGDNVISCMFHPFTGHEDTMKILSAEKVKKVVVAGGGPGGLEAAWVAAARGHQVTLLEKSDRCGGQLLAAAVPPGKQEMVRGIRYLLTMNQKYQVNIRLNTEATKELIDSFEPDVVILATGSTPIKCPVPCQDIPVAQAIDILNGSEQPGNNNIIVGGGLVGLETAAYIAGLGYQAVVVEMLDKAGKDLNASVAKFLMKDLKEKGVEIITSAKLCKVDPNEAEYETSTGKKRIRGIDKVIAAIGSRSYNPLKEVLNESMYEVISIGDAVQVRKAYAAIEEGARAALAI